MKSEFFKVGVLVDIYTDKSHIPFRNATILEVNEGGLVATQKAIDNAPVRYFPWEKMEIEFVPTKPVSTLTRTSGQAPASKKA